MSTRLHGSRAGLSDRRAALGSATLVAMTASPATFWAPLNFWKVLLVFTIANVTAQIICAVLREGLGLAMLTGPAAAAGGSVAAVLIVSALAAKRRAASPPS
jgi:hypothetical protein